MILNCVTVHAFMVLQNGIDAEQAHWFIKQYITFFTRKHYNQITYLITNKLCNVRT